LDDISYNKMLKALLPDAQLMSRLLSYKAYAVNGEA
jgi:hypothetical protein